MGPHQSQPTKQMPAAKRRSRRVTGFSLVKLLEVRPLLFWGGLWASLCLVGLVSLSSILSPGSSGRIASGASIGSSSNKTVYEAKQKKSGADLVVWRDRPYLYSGINCGVEAVRSPPSSGTASQHCWQTAGQAFNHCPVFPSSQSPAAAQALRTDRNPFSRSGSSPRSRSKASSPRCDRSQFPSSAALSCPAAVSAGRCHGCARGGKSPTRLGHGKFGRCNGFTQAPIDLVLVIALEAFLFHGFDCQERSPILNAFFGPEPVFG